MNKWSCMCTANFSAHRKKLKKKNLKQKKKNSALRARLTQKTICLKTARTIFAQIYTKLKLTNFKECLKIWIHSEIAFESCPAWRFSFEQLQCFKLQWSCCTKIILEPTLWWLLYVRFKWMNEANGKKRQSQ